MPILLREPDTYPEDLFDKPGLGVEADQQWWVVYTLSRREKELMRRLRGLGVSFYTPVVGRRSCSPSGRARFAYVPLFSNYVFINGDGAQRRLALTTNCISRCLSVPDGAGLTYDLCQIRRLIESDAPIMPEARLGPGMRVRVRSGLLQGMEGVVIKRLNQTRLLLAVNFLQQGASILFDDFLLERLD